MLRFQAGDEAAFEELVRRNVGKIHGLVYRFLGGPSLVEDITQEVFLRIHRTAPRYQPSAKFSTWLYRIVANLCFNAMRARRKGHDRQMSLGDDDAEAFFGSLPDERGDGPTRPLDREELQQRIADAVAGLPENQRVAIVLNKFEGKSYEEIAEVLQCSGMAVKSLLSRARRNLRDSLGGYVDPNA